VSLIDIVILFVAGVAAGTINTVVGSGSLVTFPTLLALGYPPVLANVTNNIGVFPGSISGAIAYRRELRGQWRRVFPLAVCSAIGGLAGALLLLLLPESAFDEIVPVLIIIACVLVVIAPRLRRWSAARQDAMAARVSTTRATTKGADEPGDGAPGAEASEPRMTGGQVTTLTSGTTLTAVYGGYFGAAQGVILLALLSILVRGGLQRANAYKNVLAATANGAAAVVFVFATPVSWLAALTIAVGSVVGGQVGGSIGRRLPPVVYRVVIVAIGLAAIVYFYAD
jgi:uncharacterized membrane protein YfcA